LQAAYDDWHKRREVDVSIAWLGEMRAAASPSVEIMTETDWQRAVAHAEAIIQAGIESSRRRSELGDMAAARVPSPHRVGPPLTIAPWLYER
jgi:hypothetical protein